MSTHVEKDDVTGRATTGHEWDGIKELNTPLPKWWLYSFYATIVFSAAYMVAYPAIPWLDGHTEGTLGYTARGAVVEDLAAARAGQGALRERIAAASLEEIRRDPDLFAFAVTGGKVAFAENCAGCHQAGGAGATGYPTLADDDWLWGGSLDQVHATIQHGIRNADAESRQSMMPRFGTDGILTPKQIGAVADYVLSLSGAAARPGAGAEGAALFAENCAACHGEKAQGNAEMGAPNLADAVWLYGGDRASVVKSITAARAGSMPAWNERLDPVTVKMLTEYVHSLGGGK
ncbi:MAG TPA: cytochrome-c oxidase, cbb3-type subunit III [Alphaproteobacteria bacterium]|nr:cytochrome-c oxidase, cbb3-type subunit III [Alphaproteobacteria bacterium]